MRARDRLLVWLRGEVKTPPFSKAGRLEAGFLLRRLQQGETLGMPLSRPMSTIGRNCHELRVRDAGHNWRLLYRVDSDAAVIAEVFDKKTRQTPKDVLEACRRPCGPTTRPRREAGRDESCEE